MATIIPPNSAIEALFKTKNIKKLELLDEDDRKREREDRQNVNTDRGPYRE